MAPPQAECSSHPVGWPADAGTSLDVDEEVPRLRTWARTCGGAATIVARGWLADPSSGLVGCPLVGGEGERAQRGEGKLPLPPWIPSYHGGALRPVVDNVG
jgi:hypothetical protein